MRMHKVEDIKVEEDLLAANRELALLNRELLDANKVVAIEVSGAIGSGKTTLIELAAQNLKEYRIAAVAGDVVASLDARRFDELGIPTIALNTGKECHLDAHLVSHALEKLPLDELDIIFIENVGNLICPADFDLGAHSRVVVVSVTEGDDIVAKHPAIFRRANLVVINKVDIAAYVEADPHKMEEDARKINPSLEVIQVSARKGYNIDRWLNFIARTVQNKR
jgi:hydrogenase nickel incorporation protein HypB